MELINVLANTVPCVGVQVPIGIVKLVHYIVLLIQVVVPILLIIWGMIDFVKAVTGGDEGKIKEGQKVFVKRIIAAVFVFLIVTIVRLIVNVLGNLEVVSGDTTTDSITTCIDHFLKGE